MTHHNGSDAGAFPSDCGCGDHCSTCHEDDADYAERRAHEAIEEAARIEIEGRAALIAEMREAGLL